jgi:hypothetical protein
VICALLSAYGIPSSFKAGNRTYGDDYAERGAPIAWHVTIASGADYDRGREFKRGFLDAMKIRGEPGAFVDGMFAAAQWLQKNEKRTKRMDQTAALSAKALKSQNK